ncbi:MAG: ABC transporter ATP-binding protein, partial [Burkholderiaceae bacterium]
HGLRKLRQPSIGWVHRQHARRLDLHRGSIAIKSATCNEYFKPVGEPGRHPMSGAARYTVNTYHFGARQWSTLVDGFALTPHLDKPLYMLSTGSKRKVLLAAALASGRALVLLDEPTGGLDAASVRCLWQALARLAQQADRAIVIASAERIDQVPLAGTIELPLP